jgi:hypothetical protein
VNAKREQQVKVRKVGKKMKCIKCTLVFSKRSKDNSPHHHTAKTGHEEFEEIESTETRLVLIPDECLDSDLPFLREVFSGGLTVGAVKSFAFRTLHINSHSLRYARITSLSRQGQPAQVIAKITHHKNLNFIVDYTSQKAADDVLRKSVNQ